MPDSELVRRAQHGDREAFDRIVARHGALVLSLARRVVRRREDAEDVAQEVFVRFLRTIDRVDPERPLEPWLVRLTLNAAKSTASRTTRRREDPIESEAAYPQAEPVQGERLQGEQFRSALGRAVGVLGPREREVFLLRDVEGLETAVVAEALGISEVTVRRHSSEGRRKVLDWFAAHHPEFLPPGGRS